MFTISRLTKNNVDALRALLTDEESATVQVGTAHGVRAARFLMSQGAAQQLIARLQERAAERWGRSSTHYLSLPAIARKVDEAAASAMGERGDT